MYLVRPVNILRSLHFIFLPTFCMPVTDGAFSLVVIEMNNDCFSSAVIKKYFIKINSRNAINLKKKKVNILFVALMFQEIIGSITFCSTQDDLTLRISFLDIVVGWKYLCRGFILRVGWGSMMRKLAMKVFGLSSLTCRGWLVKQ